LNCWEALTFKVEGNQQPSSGKRRFNDYLEREYFTSVKEAEGSYLKIR
jgi:hypothetical protein